MARLFLDPLLKSLILGLVGLFVWIGGLSRANAQDIPCNRIRTCSSLLQKYELAAATCRAEFTAYKCDEADRSTDYGKLLRECTPEKMCEEAQWFSVARSSIPGCTGAIAKEAVDAWNRTKKCWNDGAVSCSAYFVTSKIPQMAWGTVVGLYNFVAEGFGIISNPSRTRAQTASSAKMIERGWACFNPEGRFKMTCELAGGTFSRVLMGRMLIQGVRSAIVKSIAEPAPVLARRARVVENARTSAGLPSQMARAPVALIRSRAKTPAVVVAVNEFVSPTKPVAPPKRELPRVAPVRTAAAIRRDEYIERLLGRQITTVEQRRAFAELAFKAEPRGNTIFLDIQNSKMKYMNDHLKDKNLVTAITNARLKTMFDELHAKYPNLAAETFEYDDFKSGRFGFKFTDGKVPPGFLDDLRRTMNEAEEKFIAELGEFDVVPKGSELLPPDKWFASGTGLTPDEANLACRYAARTCQASVNFRDSQVLKNLGGRLTQSETVRMGAMKALRNTTLTERLPNGQVIPKLEVYEVYRKATSPSDFARRIQESTGQTMTAQTATSIMNYLKSVDEWSTGLLIVEERQSVTFAGSKFNGVTIDVSGMGALNLRELAAAMAGETDVMSAMPKARAAERSATAIFERNKASIVEAARAALRERGIEPDIRVSGDDIIVLPKNRALDSEALGALHDAVAVSPSSSNVRISAVSPGAAAADNLAVAGESLEKAVRVTTAQTVSDQSRYTLMVTTDVQGKPKLRVAAREGGVVPQTVQDAYQNAFRDALAAK